MRFTKRLLERRAPATLAVFAGLLAAAAAASCSSSEDDRDPISLPDASSDAPNEGDDAMVIRPRDAGPVDAAPLPIVCEAGPCATSLVTTGGAVDTERGEGYCALLNDGTVACWGANGSGQLGRGEEAGADDSASPARLPGLTDIVELDHTCAIDKSGGVFCWGTGPYLRSTTKPTTVERTPVKLELPPAKKIGLGPVTACASLEDGSFVCWGSNGQGQIAPLTPSPSPLPWLPQTIAMPAGAPIRQIVMGDAAIVLREDGTALSWGINPPLGRQTPFSWDSYPSPVELRGIAMIDLVRDEACAITTAGVGYCWGAVLPSWIWGELDPLDRAVPHPVASPEPIIQIATTRTVITYGLGDPIVDMHRWCGTSPGGRAYCAGLNETGQAGDGTKNHATNPVAVVGLPAPATQIKAMPRSTCALLTTGKIYCWGSNFNGQLGDGQPKGSSVVPHEVVLP